MRVGWEAALPNPNRIAQMKYELIHKHWSGESRVMVGTKDQCLDMAGELYPDGYVVRPVSLLDRSEEWIQENPARGIVAACAISALFWGAILLIQWMMS